MTTSDPIKKKNFQVKRSHDSDIVSSYNCLNCLTSGLIELTCSWSAPQVMELLAIQIF